MPDRPPFGVVSLAALDLRAAPDHKSELKSQLLLGEAVRVLSVSRDHRWWRVENRVDRYRGWIRTWGVVGATGRRVATWDRKASGIVRVSHGEIRCEPGKGAHVSPIFWRGRLIVGRKRGGFLAAELPDGRRGWVDARAIATEKGARTSIVDRIRMLFGVPYLWGGRTPLGLDCSGFTQLVLAEQGVGIPRDADDQHAFCTVLGGPESSVLGDLVFFGKPGSRVGHVGIVLGGGYYAHARGFIRVNSYVPDNPMYDKALHRQLRGFGRPGRDSRWRPKDGPKAVESA